MTDIKKLVERFLAWPLPDSVCSDFCATKQCYPHRSGTNLLSAVEAKQMFEYVLAELAAEHDKALADARRATLEEVMQYIKNGVMCSACTRIYEWCERQRASEWK